MALEPDRHREIIPTSYFATGNGGNGRNEGGNGRNGRNEKMEEIVAETASRIFIFPGVRCDIFLMKVVKDTSHIISNIKNFSEILVLYQTI